MNKGFYRAGEYEIIDYRTKKRIIQKFKLQKKSKNITTKTKINQ